MRAIGTGAVSPPLENSCDAGGTEIGAVGGEDGAEIGASILIAGECARGAVRSGLSANSEDTGGEAAGAIGFCAAGGVIGFGVIGFGAIVFAAGRASIFCWGMICGFGSERSMKAASSAAS